MAVRRVGGIIGRMYRLPGSGLVCWRPGLGSPPPLLPPLNYTGSTGLIRQLVKKRKERIEKERQEKRNEISGPSGQSDGVCLWMRNGRKKRGRNVTYRWTTRMGVWASEESGAKEGEGIAGRNASGVRGWEFLIVDDSTASCGVFQHLNNFPFHTRFPFSSFTCFKSFPFSTFAQVNGGGNWLLPLRNRSKRNDRFRKKKKKTPARSPALLLLYVLWIFTFPRMGEGNGDKIECRWEEKKNTHTPYWSTFYIIATSSRKSRDHQIPGHFLPSPLAVSENRFRWNTWWDERWYLPLFFHGFTKRLLLYQGRHWSGLMAFDVPYSFIIVIIKKKRKTSRSF